MNITKKQGPDRHRIYTSASLQRVRGALMMDNHPAAREAEGVIAAYEGLLEKLDATDLKGPEVKDAVSKADILVPFRERWKEFTKMQRQVIKAEILRTQSIYKNSRGSQNRDAAPLWEFIHDLVVMVGEE